MMVTLMVVIVMMFVKYKLNHESANLVKIERAAGLSSPELF